MERTPALSNSSVRTPHPTGGRHAITTEGPGRKATILHTISLAWLTCGVDLFIGYVDLCYDCTFEELAHLSQRTDRRKVAPIGLVEPLLMEAALSEGHTLGEAARVEALKELNLQPGGHDS